MSKKIKITVPDEIGDWLTAQATKAGITTSALAAMLTINQVNIMAQLDIEVKPPLWGTEKQDS